MHRLIRILAFAGVISHSVGGCCWHHPHRDCAVERPSTAERPHCCADFRDEHRHPASPQPRASHHLPSLADQCDEQQHGEQEHGAQCELGLCHFVVPEDGSDDLLPAADSLFSWPIDAGADNASALTARPPAERPAAHCSASLYVLHRTLLL